jgi:hypothetical protein
LQHSLPTEALLIVEAAPFATIVVVDTGPTTTLLILDRAVLTPTKVAVHHAARSADWRDIMLIAVSSAMISMNPHHTLLSLIGFWIQGLWLT